MYIIQAKETQVIKLASMIDHLISQSYNDKGKRRRK